MTAPARDRTQPVMDLVRRHAARLTRAGVPSPDHDASALAAHVLELAPSDLRITTTTDVTQTHLDRLAALVERRAERVPLQHLTGAAGFRTITLACRPGVFVPRPETEVLAGLAIEAVGPSPLVVEPCTGTGAVALSIATEVPQATVIATDRAPEAVELARCNAERLGLDVEVLHGDLLEPVDPALRRRVDVLVANPPYLTPSELDACDPEVRQHDPEGALVAGPTGHEITDRLIAAAPAWLRPGGTVLLEVAEARAAQVADRMRTAGLVDVAVVDDLTGRERIVRATIPDTSPEVRA